jgi:MYXO-CTERM domain-containing protein
LSLMGACCTSHTCYDNLTATLCDGLGGVFNSGASCNDDVMCAPITGACCIEATGECLSGQTEEMCAELGGAFYPNLSCGQCDCSPATAPITEGKKRCATAEGTSHPVAALLLITLFGLLRRRRS